MRHGADGDAAGKGDQPSDSFADRAADRATIATTAQGVANSRRRPEIRCPRAAAPPTMESTPGGAELRRWPSSPAQLPFFTLLHTYGTDDRNSRKSRPIIDSMLPTWTFDRQGEQVIVQRDTRDGSSCALIVTRGGDCRTIEFPELPALVRFQTDMDTVLLRTGWLLLNYAPDRRRRDRRRFPRVSNDRRRWRTDGAQPEEASPPAKERRRRAAK